MENIALNDIGTILAYKNETTDDQWTYLIGITSVPSTGGSPQQIEVTEMDSEYKQYISARQETPSFEFGFNYTAENYEKLNKIKGKVTEFAVILYDKSGITFTGTPDIWIESFSANSAVKGKLTISVQKKEWHKDVTKAPSNITEIQGIPQGRTNPLGV